MKQLKSNIAILAILSFIVGIAIGYYICNKQNASNDKDIIDEIEAYRTSAIATDALIESQLNEIEELSNVNDSIELLKVEIDKKRAINYKKYQDEVKRNKRIVTVNDASIVIDSILRSKGFR